MAGPAFILAALDVEGLGKVLEFPKCDHDEGPRDNGPEHPSNLT
jgi:hypothetical protein